MCNVYALELFYVDWIFPFGSLQHSYFITLSRGITAFVSKVKSCCLSEQQWLEQSLFQLSSHQLVGPDRDPQEETREQAEAVTSESEGEIEVAVPAGEEGGQLITLKSFVDPLLWIICQKLLGEGEEGLDWEYEELPEGAGGDN